MLRLSVVSVLFLVATAAQAEPEFCRTAYCDPGNGIWYPRVPLGAAYGRDVQLSPDGEWIDRSGHRSWAPGSNRHAKLLSAANSDERNGELAYQTAYDSFMEGKFNGGNRVEKVSVGRWTTKITTPDGIVMYKDTSHNVAVQSPDGKWHVTNARGQYASTTLELEKRDDSKAMVAKAKKPAKGKKAVVARAKKAKKAVVAKAAKADEGRKLASVEASQLSPDGAAAAAVAAEAAQAAPAATAAPAKAAEAKAPETKAPEAKAADAKPADAKPADSKPVAEAKPSDAKPAGSEQLLPMDSLAKLAEASRAPAAADAKPPATAAKPAEAPKAPAK